MQSLLSEDSVIIFINLYNLYRALENYNAFCDIRSISKDLGYSTYQIDHRHRESKLLPCGNCPYPYTALPCGVQNEAY